MKYLILFFVSFNLLTNSVFAQTIQWMSLDEARAAQKVNPKKIFMDVYTNWCGPCKLLEKNTFQNPDVSRYISENYYAVKFNAEGTDEIKFYNQTFSNPNYDPNRKGRNATHQFTQFLGVKGYPTMVFFSEDGDPIMPLVGYYKPKQIELYLKMIKQGDYQVFSKPEDFENYKKNFIPRFRG
ncbi:MAG: thioredoxin family protein [Flavobacteriaceae bacterium]|nr:thioredoxin family protein [Flavobacteriaceae bacterium]|tara:strand:+ start:18110 stop:18655 length:546 start_codon:yes stop_codon:yes gene_type:complete